MATCRWKSKWATVLVLCIFAAGSVSLIYSVAGRCAMGGANLNMDRVFDEAKRVSIDPIPEWGSSWPPITASLRVTYSTVYPKVSRSKRFILSDSILMPLISRASQRVLQSDLGEVAALSRYPMGKRAAELNPTGSLHIQF